MLTFAHIFENCSQDSSSVLAVVDNVFRQLSSVVPRITTVFMRADNAGCYHAALTLTSLKEIASKHNITLSRIDCSDPQGGKGSCDRKSATIKNKIRTYVNSGHDVETPCQMKEAIESSGGIAGLRVILCGGLPSQSSDVKWQGISFLNNFEIENEGIRVWRSFAVGRSKLILWKDLDKSAHPHQELNVIEESSVKENFVPVKSRRVESSLRNKNKNDDESDDEELGKNDDEYTKLFMCPEDGCIKTYHRLSSLEKHLDVGKHSYALENMTFFDKAALGYAERLEQGATSAPTFIELPPDHQDVSVDLSSNFSFADSLHQLEQEGPEDISALPMEWALKSSSTKTRLTKEQKKYLMELYQQGERTGQKISAESASKSLRRARDEDGNRIFEMDDFLTPKQVASFFSRVTAKLIIPEEIEDIIEDSEQARDDVEATREDVLSNMEQEVIDILAIQHPIMFDNLNLCNIVTQSKSKLDKFSVNVLESICNSFDFMSENKLVKYLIDGASVVGLGFVIGYVVGWLFDTEPDYDTDDDDTEPDETRSMYIAKYFDKQHADQERIRHDKAMEEYEKEMGAWRKRRQQYQDWLESEYLKKKQADENLNSTDQALSLYKAHPDFNLEEPEFHYTPSASQKKYEIAYVAGGMGLVVYGA
ncbi:hypothetical protein AC249_AIPGENE17489, partial [Exaiptasia diaphana]